jgi:hypothetical protein
MPTEPVDPVTPAERVPFKPGFLAGNLATLDNVRLAGSRCRACGVALLGRRRRCENCSSRDVEDATFGLQGTIYTFTVQRYPPPPPFAARQPWQPRAVAWVDLEAGGPRVLAPILGPAEKVAIGLPVVAQFEVAWRDEEGREVVGFSFRPAPPVGEVAS